jgi:hypothetical protein
MTVSINGTSGLTFNDASTQNTAATGFGFKNRLINSDMRIDQRNAGASVATSSGTSVYTIDRWRAIYTQTSKFTVQQNAGSVTPPTGYTNYLGVTSSSAYSITSSDIFRILQYVEGFNTADLGWGTASASPVTLSFWVRSSLTGTFGGSFQNSGDTRSYPFTYTISSANTWEQKSVTIAGDTSGTWLTTNGRGIAVIFGLGVGSTYSGTAGAWASADYISATGATSVVGTNGATFYITGVQLEKGSTATSFDYRPYGTELALCQRYYWVICNGDNKSIANASAFTSSEVDCIIQNPVEMRANPSLSSTSGTAYYNFRSGAGGQTFSTLNLIDAGTITSRLYSSTVSTTEGRGGYLKTNSASAFAAFSAEL